MQKGGSECGPSSGKEAGHRRAWSRLLLKVTSSGALVFRLWKGSSAYERFSPQTPDGAADAARGIRQFVVGTGGRSHYSFGTVQPNSEARDNTAFGVLRLTLRAGGYDWEFVPEAGKTFTDRGSATCH